MFQSEEFPGEFETDILAFADPRTSFNGVRVICGEGSFEIDDKDVKVHQDESEYNVIRHINAVVEGSKECGGQFPLHLSFNQLNGISTTKGCYIGQELIQRTTHVGTVRKQTLPFIVRTAKLLDKLQIDPDNFNALRFVDRDFSPSKAMQGMDIKDQKGTRVGKILGSQFNVGSVMVDMPRIYKNGVNAKYFLEDQQIVMWQPAWLRLIEAQ